MNRVPRPNPQRCTYYHKIGHHINECPFIENNVRQGFVEYFQNLNPKPIRVENHGYSELEELYHERIRIPNRVRKQIWRNNRVEMKIETVVDVILVFLAPTPSLLHHNDVGVTYLTIFLLGMERVRSVPLYFVVMPQSMVTITEVPFVTTLIHIVVHMRSKP